MTVAPELQGKRFPPTQPYLVGREKIREFARAVLSTSPVNFDVAAAKAAGYTDLIAPPTFPVVVDGATFEQLLAEPGTGIELSRIVHGEQRFSYSRPIVAGDELVATLTVASVRSAGGNSMITTESNIVDLQGHHVVTTTSTLVVRGEA